MHVSEVHESDVHVNDVYLLLLLLKEVGNARLELRERLTPYQSEDPYPTTPTHIE